MPTFHNPKTVAAPASRYSQGVSHALDGRRLVISGQIGVRPDGSVVEGLEAQMAQCWDNLIAVLADAGMQVEHLVKVTVFVTVPGAVAVYRKVRDEKLRGHPCAMTYLEISGLASPAFLVEIEGEAVLED